MKLFPTGHATHPQWRMALALVLAQLRGQMALPSHAAHPTLGILYITDYYAADAEEILATLGAELPTVTDWAGAVGVGVSASNAEYFDEPALSVMLCDLPAHQYRVFSGVAPLGSLATGSFEAHTALVHADGETPELTELIEEMAGRTATGYLFGGLVASRHQSVQFAVGGNGNIKGQGAASGVFRGGMSGVAFSEEVALISRVTQGCQPVGPAHTVSRAEDNVLLEFDGGKPALDALLQELKVSLDEPRSALAAVRATLAGLQAPEDGDGRALVGRTGHFGTDTQVRHIIGLDPGRRGVAVAEKVRPGMQLAFCQRNAQAARADLMRVCAEIREELEPQEMSLELATALAGDPAVSAPHAARRIAGAIYVSCSGRGGPHFGAPGAELAMVRHALGDVPLVGFFANGEIARNRIFGYTGVLTVFVQSADAGDARG